MRGRFAGQDKVCRRSTEQILVYPFKEQMSVEHFNKVHQQSLQPGPPCSCTYFQSQDLPTFCVDANVGPWHRQGIA